MMCVYVPLRAWNGSLVIQTGGGSGDADIYVKHNAKPVVGSNAKSIGVGTVERVRFNHVLPGK